MDMDTNYNIDTAKAYLEGMLWAAYGAGGDRDGYEETGVHLSTCFINDRGVEINKRRGLMAEV